MTKYKTYKMWAKALKKLVDQVYDEDLRIRGDRELKQMLGELNAGVFNDLSEIDHYLEERHG